MAVLIKDNYFCNKSSAYSSSSISLPVQPSMMIYQLHLKYMNIMSVAYLCGYNLWHYFKLTPFLLKHKSNVRYKSSKGSFFHRIYYVKS